MKRSADAAAHLSKADRALSAGKVLFRENEAEGACNRAYYAMFHAACAALVTVVGDRPEASIKTHRGLIGAFGKYVVQGGHLPMELGSALNKAERLRKIADYTGDPVTVDDARWALEQAERFVGAIRERLSS